MFDKNITLIIFRYVNCLFIVLEQVKVQPIICVGFILCALFINNHHDRGSLMKTQQNCAAILGNVETAKSHSSTLAISN